MSRAETLRAPLVEESAEELYEHAPCGYLSTLPDGMIIRVNQTFLDWTGYSRAALLEGKRLQDLLPVAGKVFHETHYAPMIRMHGFVREIALDLVCADQTVLPVLINAVLQSDPDGVPLLIRTSIYDVTERRRYERELVSARRRAEQLAAVVQAAGDAIFITNRDGAIQTWNGGAERLFGYSAAEAQGRQVQDLITLGGSEDYIRALRLAQAGKETHLLETTLAGKDSRRVEASVSLSPHLEPPGEVVAISSIIRDVTERRLLEKQLQQAEKLQSVGTLAGGVAHEVNNQMTVVLGFGNFVMQGLGAEHPQSGDVQRMINAAERAARVSRQLLAFSRQQLIHPENFSLAALVLQLAPGIRDLLGSHNALILDDEMPAGWINADAREIERVLIQLTRNACDAMPGGGEFRIRVEDRHLTQEDARLHPGDEVQPGDYVLLTASDTGNGMDESTLRRAFEPFFTTKSFGEGMGLGLATVYGVVKQHGGQVWATSTLGKGTTVQVYLPAVGEQSEDAAADGAGVV